MPIVTSDRPSPRATGARAPKLPGIVRRAVLDIGLFSLLINLLMLAMPLYLLQVYDRVLPSASIETLIYLSLIAIGALIVLGVMEVIRSFYAQRVAAGFDRSLASTLFGSILLSKGAGSGDLQPLCDLGAVRGFIASKGLTALFDLPFAPLFVVLLYLVHPALFWITLAGVILMLALLFINLAAERSSGQQAAELTATAQLSAQAFARTADSLRAMGMEANATEHWGARYAKSLRQQARSAAINATFSGISRSVRMLLQLAILGVGAWLVLGNEMTAGMIFAASIISGRALQPIDQLIGGWRQIAEARKAWGRIGPVAKAMREAQSAKTELPVPLGAISVRDLVVARQSGQPGAKPILQGLSFDIGAGEAIALIGPSRAGKTTLARCLTGAIAPSGGSVSIDGAELGTWNQAQRKSLFGYLPQDVQLLPGTIAQNIARFDPDPEDQAIVAAARRAHAHELVLLQGDGYQTEIGSAGTGLSGGERQRIGLARAFYGDPKILVLDEPNANLDAAGEEALAQALADARAASTTVVIVTHRLSIAAKCDRVMMLQDGAIAAFGPSQDVLASMTANRPAAAPPAKKGTFPMAGPGFSMGSQWRKPGGQV
ncbi:type I secretion system permease/ATPase [uncultured Hoeflea sp.]|uniref:type I secretion system permease/ATPase n=1 Tax=uncultured Hoeflea sp. TaxID=538666 RepID=UPI00261DE738|nr:type I secretion system permease/ATPase [uncultured Hoeflea sp.]